MTGPVRAPVAGARVTGVRGTDLCHIAASHHRRAYGKRTRLTAHYRTFVNNDFKLYLLGIIYGKLQVKSIFALINAAT